MRKERLKGIVTTLLSIMIGMILGISMDKSWLADDMYQHVQALRQENGTLVAEKRVWEDFLRQELSSLAVFMSEESHELQSVGEMLSQMGVEAKPLLSEQQLLERKGILIALGEYELEEDVPLLALEEVPTTREDYFKFYISLLRMKEVVGSE